MRRKSLPESIRPQCWEWSIAVQPIPRPVQAPEVFVFEGKCMFPAST